MRWALSRSHHPNNISREWQCTFDDHGGAFDAVILSLVLSVVLVTKLAMEGEVTFRRSLVQFLSSLGGDDRVN